MPAKRVGLLGGSFNPAHAGHRYISLLALKRLRLDEVWWLVSPQNPLKETEGMAPFGDRLEVAERVANHPLIVVSDIERTFGTVYTIDTLTALKRRFPRDRFVWIMGADNLIQIPRWRRWRRIFATVPIAVFVRPPYSIAALFGKAARSFKDFRVPESRVRRLAEMRPPAWAFLHARPHRASATRIRTRRGAATEDNVF